MAFNQSEELKFRLLTEGVRIDPPAASAWHERFRGPLTLAEYATTSGVSLVLGDDLYVNAPLSDGASSVLAFEDDGFVVRHGSDTWASTVIPVPSYHDRTQRDLAQGGDQRYTNYGVTHTDRCRVSPIGGCAWKCKFCDLPYELSYRKKHPDNLLAVIEAAAEDEQAPARHVLVSGGTPRAPVPERPGRPASDDEAWIDDVYEYLAGQSPLPVDVMLPPRKDLRHPARLRQMGINMVSINVEIYDEQRVQALAPAKARVGSAHTLNYIERAVEAFGVGNVQSLVLLGSAIEPVESTLSAVRALAERGCIPVLSPFRPHSATPLAHAPSASLSEVLYAYERAREICDLAGTDVRPGPRCIACQHNTATLPDGSDFYIDASGPFPTSAAWTS